MRVDGAVLRLHLDPLLRDGRSASLEVPPEALPKALGDALAEVRSYLPPAVTLPTLDADGGAELPDLLAGVVLDLAAWQLTLAYYGPVAPDSGEPVMLRYARSRKVLLDLAAGRATLPAEAALGAGGTVTAINPAWHGADLIPDRAASPAWGGYGSNGYGPWDRW